MKQYDAGIQGEAVAEAYLCQKGMQVVARRYRGGDGEIDLIMLDGQFVVFIEVKARPKSARGDGLSAITPAKRQRIIHAALHFLLEREWMERMIRFDVVEISRNGVLHIPNAFQSE